MCISLLDRILLVSLNCGVNKTGLTCRGVVWLFLFFTTIPFSTLVLLCSNADDKWSQTPVSQNVSYGNLKHGDCPIKYPEGWSDFNCFVFGSPFFLAFQRREYKILSYLSVAGQKG